MARPARFSVDQYLDAAVELVHDSGPAAVSMTAVAERTGSPSGSLYHRFPHRTALLGELWLRTVRRFQDGFFARFEIADPRRAAAAAARYTVEWSTSEPAQAAVLSHPRADYEVEAWPAELERAAAGLDRRLRREVARLTARLEAEPELVAVAVIDIPYALVRRHLTTGRRIPRDAPGLVEDCAMKLLAGA